MAENSLTPTGLLKHSCGKSEDRDGQTARSLGCITREDLMILDKHEDIAATGSATCPEWVPGSRYWGTLSLAAYFAVAWLAVRKGLGRLTDSSFLARSVENA
jgi:hypothetical protein